MFGLERNWKSNMKNIQLRGVIHTAKEQWKKSKILKCIDAIVNYHYRRNLKNDGFTILCSNCIGGTISHRFGKRFLSPTINLYLTQADFIQFCVYLDYYLPQKLVFIDTDKNHPVAELHGDGKNIPTITIYFNHAKTNLEAEEAWNRRKARVNRDNLYIILYYLDGLSIDDLKKLETVKCNNKVVFTAKHLPDISWSYYIKPNMNHKYPYNYLEKNVFGIRYFERYFNIIEFLNASAPIKDTNEYYCKTNKRC